MIIRNIMLVSLLLIALSLLTACAGSPKVVDNHFGDSVRNMVKHQVFYAETLKHPPTEQVEGQNGNKAIIDFQKIYRISNESKQQSKSSTFSSNKQ